MRKLWQTLILMEANKENGGGGGFPKPPGQSEIPAGEPASEGNGNTDDFGYDIVPEKKEEPPTKPAAKPPEQKAEPAKAEEPASGYGVEPPKVDPPATPEPEKKDPPAEADDLDKALEGLEDAAKYKEFAKTNNLSADVVKKFADVRREEIANEAKALENWKKEQARQLSQKRADWDKELREDKTFGGANFDSNVKKAERVLAEFMPGMKKELTERKGMLPPYVMRDLAKLHETLYATETLVQGEPKVEESPAETSSPLDYYT